MMPSRNNAAAGSSSIKVKYSKLADSDEGYIDLQFKKLPTKIPYKAIALATILFLIGSLLITIGALLLTGYISSSVRNLVSVQFHQHPPELEVVAMTFSGVSLR
ncbi:transmembrane protein 230b isoform X2 [Cetorhinus maximus]